MKEDFNWKQTHGKISTWDNKLRMLVSKSKTIIHAVHGIFPGMIGLLRRPMYLETRRMTANRLRRTGNLMNAMIAVFSHRHFVTKLWGVWNFADEKFLYSQICRLAAKRRCNFGTDRRCPRTAPQIGTDEVTGFYRQ